MPPTGSNSLILSAISGLGHSEPELEDERAEETPIPPRLSLKHPLLGEYRCPLYQSSIPKHSPFPADSQDGGGSEGEEDGANRARRKKRKLDSDDEVELGKAL